MLVRMERMYAVRRVCVKLRRNVRRDYMTIQQQPLLSTSSCCFALLFVAGGCVAAAVTGCGVC